MIVKELISKLKEYPEDLLVTIYADHGQLSEGATQVYSLFLDEEGEPWTDIDTEPPEDYTMVLEIAS